MVECLVLGAVCVSCARTFWEGHAVVTLLMKEGDSMSTLQLFIIHRFNDRKKVKALFKKTGREMAVKVELVLLDSTGCENWKDQAIDAIAKAEAVIIFDRKSCEESENAKWEMNSELLDLYKLMIDSSENLIQRRQRTNAFFITAIESLLAIAGLLVKSGALNSATI